ncbi:hypothetical protein cypCar_00005229, partial [Cyprinus carpio]
YKHSAKFCRQNKLGHFPIHAAAFAGAKKSMDVNLLKGEEVGLSIDTHINYVDKSCSSPLHLAVCGENLDIIKLCIAYGAKIEQQQCDISTALHFLCSQGAYLKKKRPIWMQLFASGHLANKGSEKLTQRGTADVKRTMTTYNPNSTKLCIVMIEFLPESFKHPELKKVAYGIKAHLLSMTVYVLGVFPLTYLIVNLKPTMVTARNVTSVNMVCTCLYKAELHTILEERLPYWFMKRVDQVTIKESPNRCFSGKVR